MSFSKEPSAEQNSRDAIRNKVIGLGDKSFHKNYYGKLKHSLRDLELFRSIMEQIADIIILIDSEDIILDANQAAFSFLGKAKDEVKGVSIYSFESICYKCLKKQGEDSVLQGDVSEGSREYLFSLKEVILSGSSYYVLIGKDVSSLISLQTAQRKAEEQLHEYQKTELVGLLAGETAHDFNNILSSVMGAVSLLAVSPGISINPEDRKMIEMIQESVAKASELVSQLMDLSRKGKTEREAVSLNTLLKDSASLLEHTVDRRITVDYTDNTGEDCVIQGSRSRLHSAFMNLGINAGHAISGVGHIEFRLSKTIIDESYCRESSFSLRPGEYFKVEVEDTGSGIPPELLSRIFEALFTTREGRKGTGLGLSSVMNTIRDHSGEITVQSRVGQGSVFSLLIPAPFPSQF